MGQIKIYEVKNRKQLKDFIHLPEKIYQSNPESRYISPLHIHTKMMLGKIKEAGKHLLLAEKDGELVGRVGIKIHHHSDEKLLHFGFFECLQGHQDAAKALFNHAHALYPELLMRGPYHFVMEDPYIGSLIYGFDEEPYIFMSYNDEYVDEYLLSSGLKKSIDLMTYKINVTSCPQQIEKIAQRSQERTGVHYRWLNPKKLKKEVKTIAALFNEALADNWGFEEITDSQLEEMYMIFKFFIDPRLVIFLTKDGEDVGCAILLPNLNHLIKQAKGRFSPGLIYNLFFRKKEYDSARAYAMGLKKKYQGSGIVCQIISAIYQRCLDLGIKEVEISWVLENNRAMNEISKSMGGVHNKTYRVYEKPALN